AAALGGLDALRIDEAQTRALLPPGAVANPGPQGLVDLGPRAVVAPLPEGVVAGAPGGPVRGHHPPGTAAAEDGEDAVADLTQRDGPRPSAGLGRWQQPPEAFPLGPSQIARVAFGFHAEL